MIDDLIKEDHSRVDVFKNYAKSVKESPWAGFFNLLQRLDGFIVNQVCRTDSRLLGFVLSMCYFVYYYYTVYYRRALL